MQLSKKTINDLDIILREEFNLKLNSDDLSRFAHFLVGYFDILYRSSKFGNHPVSLIDKDSEKEENYLQNSIKSVLLSRVSKREQAEEGYSLPAQEKLLEEYAEKKDFLITKKFSVPESASGKQERKLFNLLLQHLNSHPEITVVLCEKVDRISRNFKDSVKLDDWVNENEHREIHFVKQNLIIHKNAKSNEKFMWDIYLAMARQYSNNLSEETKKGMNEKAEQGHFPGNHKRGYKSVGDVGHKTWFVDTEKSDAKYIEMAFVAYNTGNYTLRTLSNELFLQGWKINGKKISTSELHKLLTDPFYCGQFIFKGKLYPEAKHPPLISKELFHSVQERLQRKIKAGKYRKHSYLLGGGLIICDSCGRSITVETQKGHNYYHCTKYNNSCKQKKYTREEELEEQVVDFLDNFKITNPRLLEWVRKALKESHKEESTYYTSLTSELENKKKQVEKRLSALYDDRLDGNITKEFYEEKHNQYKEELEDILTSLGKHAKANINYQELGINIFELSQKGRQIYDEMLLQEEKRELLNFVFLNLKLRDGKLIPSLHNGFEVIASRAKDGNWLGRLDSNQNTQLQRLRSYH